MTPDTGEILARALQLPPLEKARLVDQLLAELDKPDEAIDSLWRKEVEDRIQAYQQGKLKALPMADVLSRYRK
jgi:putative addiction module component (TIGR02574 family)